MENSKRQSVKVVARTFETQNNSKEETDNMNKELTILSGKAAGVCYMPDDYMENGIQNEDKAFSRAEQTAENGHHSVYDHGHISFVIKTNKMMCMILNSLGVYATSEKSARYTKMQPETKLEADLYDKWKVKIQKLILHKYPDIDDYFLSTKICKQMGVEKSRIVNEGKVTLKDDGWLQDELAEIKNKFKDTLPSSKLAQENARYMISVFTPTTMMYTVSFRQTFLIMDYLAELVNNCGHAEDTFSKKLLNSVTELLTELSKAVGDAKLHDNKNQYIRFLEAQHLGETIGEMDKTDFKLYDDLDKRLQQKKISFTNSYTLVYTGSLAMLAQAQRHRTLRYTMRLQEPGERGYYIPEIVKDAGLSAEWLMDIASVAYCIPQGTMVRITEQGLFEDFVLKCKERMCGRTQLEIMKQTTSSIKGFINNKENLSYTNQKLLESITLDSDSRDCEELTPCARCQFKDFKCSEGCNWGAKEALTRYI